MIDNRFGRLVWSTGLSFAGLVLLLFSSGLLERFQPAAQYLLSALLLLGGFAFFGAYASSRESWWRLMPGWTLLALCGMSFLSTIERIDQRLNGSVLFLGLALAFFHIYILNRRERWWTIIPGGFMLVIGAVVGLSSFIERAETLGGILFVGMGGVFFLLYSLGRSDHRWWSLIPASILGVFGMFVFTLNGFGENSEPSFFVRWWPLLLIMIGGYIGFRTARAPVEPEKIMVKSAPKSRYKPTGPSSGAQGQASITSQHRERGLSAGMQSVRAWLTPRKLLSQKHNESESKTISREGPLPGTSIEILPDD